MHELGQIFDDFDSIKIISNCPICNTKYSTNSTKVLEEKENGHLVHIECKRCKSSMVALIFSNNMGVSSISLITDLNSRDAMKFKDENPININEVIDLHHLLKTNNIQDLKL